MQKFIDSVNVIIQKDPGVEGFTIPQEASHISNFLKENPDIKLVGEIGFNVGMSSASMLNTRDDILVYSFDIGHHPHIQTQKKVIDECFPDRHVLLLGDSTKTLPLLYKLQPGPLFDFIFVDGGHQDPVPYLDMMNSLKLLKPGGYMCVDDYCEQWGKYGVIQAYNKLVENGDVEHLASYKFGDRGWVYCRKPLETQSSSTNLQPPTS
jgi:predicted O-methyltransferase YrrM